MAIAHVQSRGVLSSGVSHTTTSLAFTTNVISGNLLVATCKGGTITGVTSTRSGAFTRRVNGTIQIWTAEALGTGSCTVTVTHSNTSYTWLVIEELSGVNLASPIDNSTYANNKVGVATTDGNTLGPITLTYAGSFVVAAIENNSGSWNSITPGTGWTERWEEVNSNDIQQQDRLYSAAGSATATWTCGNTNRFNASMVAFRQGVSGYTLTADGTTFTETGTAANPEYHRRVTASAAAYTETGTDATLRTGRPLPAASGSFTETGTDAALRAAWKLAVDSASFIETGTAATFPRTYEVAADSGAFTHTGATADLKTSGFFGLFADDTSYSVTGTAASTLYGYRVTAGAGAFTQTGSDASKRMIFILSATYADLYITDGTATLMIGTIPLRNVFTVTSRLSAAKASARTAASAANRSGGAYVRRYYR